MTRTTPSGTWPHHDPELDLVLERVIDIPPERVWEAWTRPEHLEQWFAPRPWRISDLEIDVRPGGIFRMSMRSPEGEEFPNAAGCYLEVIENRKLVFTDALGPGFRPKTEPFFTAIVTMEPAGEGTRYVARAVHLDVEGRRRHEEMGFHEGWSTVLDQMVEYVKSL